MSTLVQAVPKLVYTLWTCTGTTINDLGVGPEEIKKKNSKAILQEKINFMRPFPGKKKFKRHSRGKNEFIEPTCANARWALNASLSVCSLSVCDKNSD